MIIGDIIKKAKKLNKKIVFPEATDSRILKAAVIIRKKKLAEPIFVGNPSAIRKAAKKAKANIKGIKVYDNKKDALFDDFAKKLCVIRKDKGLTIKEAKKLLLEPIYFGVMLVKQDLADGLISGATHPTDHTLKPAIQIIKTRPGEKIASSFFIMKHPKKLLFFADCGFVVNPSAEELAEIAIQTAESAMFFCVKPVVAMISFSTKGSAHHPDVDKVVKATKIAKKKRPDLLLDGELQVDAAIVPEVAKMKCPKSPVKGNANILIFPDLDTGNVAYKLAQRLAGDEAIGPIVQGLNKPVNDLSRGCSIKDIVTVAAITACQSEDKLRC